MTEGVEHGRLLPNKRSEFAYPCLAGNVFNRGSRHFLDQSRRLPRLDWQRRPVAVAPCRLHRYVCMFGSTSVSCEQSSISIFSLVTLKSKHALELASEA
jgi:hypothetical protein